MNKEFFKSESMLYIDDVGATYLSLAIYKPEDCLFLNQVKFDYVRYDAGEDYLPKLPSILRVTY